MRSGLVAILLVILAAPAPGADGEDLARSYPATLDHPETPQGYSWTCDENDVWRVNRFVFAVEGQIRVELKSARVVIGRHKENALWAAIFPDEPGDVVKASAGQGEHISSIWLRFHPARVAELFPAATIEGHAKPDVLGDARRIAAHKMRSCWQAGGLPMIPTHESVTIDLETFEGPRRFYSVDTDRSVAEYADAFRTRPLPVPKPIDAKTAVGAFDAVWNAFDREYAMFGLKPEVDWAKLREDYRPRAAKARSNHQLAELLAELLAHLKDLHVGVQVDRGFVPVYDRDRPLNANRAALPVLVGEPNLRTPDLLWAITKDGIGYVAIGRLTARDLPRAFIEILAKMEGTGGLILDLRENGGGSEPLAQEITGSFLDQERVYAKSVFRNGPEHADLTPPQSRICVPRDPWHYVAPVIVLQGQRTMSSAEAFVLMLSQAPQVTTMGDRTAGSSGNPRPLDAGAGIVVSLPRWNPLDAEGKPFDTIGIPADVGVEAGPDAFRDDRDPVLSAALERLRANEKLAEKSLVLRPGAQDPNTRPRIVAVFPANSATDVEVVTEIRIRFDRPMDPASFAFRWRAPRGKEPHDTGTGFRLRGEPAYHPANNEFVFPIRLTPGAEHRIELESDERHAMSSMYRPFQSTDGVSVPVFAWSFHTGKGRDGAQPEAGASADGETGPSAPQFKDDAERSTHIAAAGHSESLLALVVKIRQRRLGLKSVVEHVVDRTRWTHQPVWFQQLIPEGRAQFWWQGETQIRADGGRFFFVGMPLQVGADGRQAWSRIAQHFIVGPAESITLRNVLICDPLQAGRDMSDEMVIKDMQLEYAGDEEYRDANCHRLRSWWLPDAKRAEIREWLFDTKSLLPVVFEGFSGLPTRFEFTYDSIDEELGDELFQPPMDARGDSAEPEPLGIGFNQRFFNALDGSAGRISIRWGKTGARGTYSSGLN